MDTAFEFAEGAESPLPFVATTEKVKVLLAPIPLIVQLVAPVVTQLSPPGEAVAVYPVIVDPPSLSGTLQAIVTVPELNLGRLAPRPCGESLRPPVR